MGLHQHLPVLGPRPRTLAAGPARGGGFLALVHALLAIRDLPDEQREAWRHWFDHFVFGAEAPHAADHIPAAARGVTGPPSPQRDETIRQFLLKVLGSG